MDIEKKHFTCVTCPVGCEVDVEVQDGSILSMTGNKCDKVKEFVLQELKEPMRVSDHYGSHKRCKVGHASGSH